MTNIMEQHVDQAWFQFPAATAGRLLDGTPQFLATHRAYVFLSVGQRFAQRAVGCAVSIEVGAQGD